ISGHPNVRVYRLDDERDTSWEEVPGVMVVENQAVFETMHFSIFTIGGECVPVQEICDTVDNDCDGSVDEENVCNSCDPACGGKACGAGNGCSGSCPGFCRSSQVCNLSDGAYGCVEQGNPGGNPSCTPTTEGCDTIDNDCDGKVDEGS